MARANACALLSMLCMILPGPGYASGLSWVTRSGHQLMVNGKPFYFVGTNSYWLVDYAVTSDRRYLVTELFQRAAGIGLKVVRTWAFNHAAPASSGYGSNSMYHDEKQMQGLDFIIQQANSKGIYLVLAAGNLWPHYVGPEVFLSAAGETGDILTFYGSTKARALYQAHLQFLFNRVNTLTGVAYKDDPTIMGWDVMNEPRCPGCTDAASKAVHNTWLQEMSEYARSQSPRQLMMMGTEGFFGMDDSNKLYNPGAGSACEGEDWMHDSALPSLSVSTLHLYWRQTEGVRDKGWARMSFSEYVSFIDQYLDLHTSLAAGSLGKPLLLEEFNILSGRFSESERAAVFSLVLGKLNASRQAGGALSGAMFWNGAISGVPDDGYNVYLDQVQAPRRLLSLASDQASALRGNPGRRLHENLNELDEFRRRGARAACAEAEAGTFRPAYSFTSVNSAQLLARVVGKTVLDVVVQAA